MYNSQVCGNAIHNLFLEITDQTLENIIINYFSPRVQSVKQKFMRIDVEISQKELTGLNAM